MASMWDSVVASAVASASKAATQAGEATQVAATKAKLRADLLVIDRDINSRKERFGVEMYAHLEGITSTQEFYVADDRLINVIRPTLIRAQREVAAYERKRDAMRGKVNLAEANRTGTASIFGAATIGEKLMNAANFVAAGAKEAGAKTELAMLERQILGFKEEFGVELYPIFESMEDNEGWLPTDRKVRSLYDAAREDIAKMQRAKEEKVERIRKLDGAEGSGLTPPVIPAAMPRPPAPATAPVATPVIGNYQPSSGGGQPWASPEPAAIGQAAATSDYGATQAPAFSSLGGAAGQVQQQQQHANGGSGFEWMQQANGGAAQPPASATQYSHDAAAQQQQQPYGQSQQQQGQGQASQRGLGSVFDPFDGIAASGAGSSFSGTAYGAAPPPQPSAGNTFDPYNNQGGQSKGNLSAADLNLFKY